MSRRHKSHLGWIAWRCSSSLLLVQCKCFVVSLLYLSHGLLFQELSGQVASADEDEAAGQHPVPNPSPACSSLPLSPPTSSSSAAAFSRLSICSQSQRDIATRRFEASVLSTPSSTYCGLCSFCCLPDASMGTGF